MEIPEQGGCGVVQMEKATVTQSCFLISIPNSLLVDTLFKKWLAS